MQLKITSPESLEAISPTARAVLSSVPSLALSIRQPWAWLIANGWKNVENREWPTKLRGPIWIHAGKAMPRDDYDACRLFIDSTGMTVPLPCYRDLERGGIVGRTTILDCVTSHPSEWFTGPFGFVLAESLAIPFHLCKGSLGFFRPQLAGWPGR